MGETLNYYTCGNWMKLALFAQRTWQEWLDRPQGVDPESDDIPSFFREVAQYAFDMGFSLRQGDRVPYGFTELLDALGDERLKHAYYRLNREDWLTPSKTKARGGDGYFYVLATPIDADGPFYFTVGSIIGDYMGRPEHLNWNGVYGPNSRNSGTLFQTESYTEAKRVRDLALRSRLYSKVTTTTKPPKKEENNGPDTTSC